MNHQRRTMRYLLRLAVVVLALGLLTACGSDDSADGGSSAPGGASEGARPEGGGPGGDPTQFAAIQQCLTAAGLGDVLPSGGPGEGGTPPTDMPTGSPPSGAPSGAPGGGPDGPGGGFAALDDPEVQAALESCGIEIPTP
jgi:hypothetical protein